MFTRSLSPQFRYCRQTVPGDYPSCTPSYVVLCFFIYYLSTSSWLPSWTIPTISRHGRLGLVPELHPVNRNRAGTRHTLVNHWFLFPTHYHTSHTRASFRPIYPHQGSGLSASQQLAVSVFYELFSLYEGEKAVMEADRVRLMNPSVCSDYSLPARILFILICASCVISSDIT